MTVFDAGNMRGAEPVDPTIDLGEPTPRSVMAQIADRVAERPGGIAVESPGRTLTYEGLWAESGSVAGKLVDAGVSVGERVAICADRTVGFVVALLAVLRSGAVAVPLSADLPAKRRLLMASEAGVTAVLLAEGAAGDAGDLHRDAGRIVIDVRNNGSGTLLLPSLPVGDFDHAYVYFTSGSTGVPKGILGTHRGLSHFVTWQRHRFDFVPGDRVALLKTISFDPVLREVFTPLIAGGTVCVPPTTLEARDVVPWVGTAGITAFQATPALGEIWRAEMPAGLRIPSVRLLMFAGEILMGSLVEAWRAIVDPSCEIVNMYGPTETTMIKTYHVVSVDEDALGIVPAGRPLPDSQVFVVSDGHLCEPGESGEVLLRTKAGTLGYINNAAAQAEAFVPNPFTDDTNDTVYRTGDHGYLSTDGTLTVTGRIDNQVKVLGVRIELGEVAAHIRKHPGVDAVAVVPDLAQGTSTRLTAHVVAGSEDVDATALRRHLLERLPRTMIPSRIVFTDALPLTVNGKVDTRALQAASPPQEEAARQPASDRLAERLKRLSGPERAAAVAALRDRASASAEPGSENDDGVPTEHPEGADGIGEAFPLSFSQERLWFLDRLDPGSAAYNMKFAARLSGPLDVAALREAFNVIEARHAVLRTRYPDHDGQPQQVVELAGRTPFEIVDTAAAPGADPSRLLNETASEQFDLAQGPVWRIRVIRLDSDVHLLIIVFHHIAADGWSVPVLLRELEELYAAQLSDREPNLPKLSIQYVDHARRQRRRFSEGAFDEGLAYWAEQLAGPLAPLDLPTDRPRPRLQTSRGGRIDFELTGVDTAALDALCAQEGATPSIAWLALFNAFLYRYSGTTDIIVGGPSADRDAIDTEQLVGFFVNTLAYRTIVDPSSTFRGLLGLVRRSALDAYQRRDIPFERIVMEVDAERDPSRTPIFQVMLQYRDFFDRDLQLEGILAEPAQVGYVASKFDLELELAAGGGDVRGRLTFNSDLYDEKTVRRMMHHFALLAGDAVNNPDRSIDDLCLMDIEEREQLLLALSGGETLEFDDVTVVEAIAGWAAETPSAVAVSQGDRSISYADLDRLARSVAARLKEVGVTATDRVVISMRRTPELIAAILGVLRAGAAYVPIDPTAPDERNAAIVEDARPAAVLLDDTGTTPLPVGVPVIRLPEAAVGSADLPAPPLPGLDDPAYIIYTSGTTGRPKGVVVEHQSLAAFAKAANKIYGPKNTDRLLQFHSFAFDSSVEEVFCTLTAGGRLVLRTDEMLASIDRFLDEAEGAGLTILDLPTAFWNVLAAQVLRSGRPLPPTVHTVIIGGEAADPDLVARWKLRFDGSVRLFNTYGPTETTVTATAVCLSEVNDPGTSAVTIGRPLAATTAFVVDHVGIAVPVGVRGELWIGGARIAQGYFDDPELTGTRFRPSPFGRSGRIYRTGDLVRWRPDGNLEFLGRIDRQIKVRGYRIEPGEIESQLVQHPDVSVAFVHSWEGGSEPALVGYVVPEAGRNPNREEIADSLKNRLPDYMIPTIEMIDELPRNQNDKVDTARLPEPSSRRQSDHIPPRGDAMIRMATIWAEVLGSERIGAEDRFFEIGGHSLLAVEMVSRVEREFRTIVPLATIFSHPTLAEFTRRVTSDGRSLDASGLVPISPGGDRRPLFCLPVTDGSVLAYQRLTRHLSPDIPIYGLQARGSDGMAQPHRTISDMCDEYADTIVASGPGPYRLLGASYAGLLAVETAERLIERGESVDLAVMLDTVLPLRQSWLARQRRRQQIIQTNGPSGLAFVARGVWRSARIGLGRIRHTPRWYVREVTNRPLSAELAGKRLTHVSLEADRRFEPTLYRSAVLYFRAVGAELPLDERRDDPWHRYVENLDVMDSPGTHWGEGSMLDEPHLADVCSELNRRFADFDGIGGAR